MLPSDKLKNLPDSPGVYFFLGKKKEILYIGKATSLRSRVRSYFGKNLAESRSFLIESLAQKIRGVKYQKTDSILEALILEANLIKKHQPKYNTQDKDDKSFNYVVITDENLPRVLLERGKNLTLDPKPYTLMAIYGPYTHNKQLKDALKIIRKIFPFLDEKTGNLHTERFYQELGLAPKIDGSEAKKEYKRTIRHLKLFFEGKKKRLIGRLENEMEKEVKKQNFEKSTEIRDKIFALKHIQDVALIKSDFYPRLSLSNPYKSAITRIEAYDISHIMGKFVVGAMAVLKDGNLQNNSYRKFKIKLNPGINDIRALKEVLQRRLNHKEWPMPNLIVVDGGIAQKRVAEQILKEKNLNIPVVAVTKDEKHRPKHILGDKKTIDSFKGQILEANTEAHRFALAYHKNLRDRIR